MTDIIHTSTLAEVFARLEQISSYIKLQVGQPEGDGWYAQSDFARSDSLHLDAALERMKANNKSEDRQFSATAFISSYSYQFTAGGIGCFMTAKRVPDFSPENIRVHFDEAGWVDKISLLEGRFFALPDDPEAGQPYVTVVEDINALRDELRIQIEAHMADVIGALKVKTGMGKRGMWGLVADRLAGTLIYACKLLDQQHLCQSELDALIHVVGSHLNGKTNVLTLEHAGRTEQFLERGACCKYYKSQNYGYCSTCPIQKPEERIRRLREHMEKSASH